MHTRLRGSKRFLTLYQTINKTWLSFLVDEIAETRPNMNIKVAAFTVSEKSINTQTGWVYQYGNMFNLVNMNTPINSLHAG